MPDNTALNAGSGGDLVATDECVIGGATVKVQRVKLHLGADGVSEGDVGSANPVPIRDITNGARTLRTFFTAVPVLSTATDSLLSLTSFTGTAAVAAATAPAVVAAGKRLRITSIIVTYVATATAGGVTFTLRANPAGVVTAASAAVAAWTIGGASATAGMMQSVTIDLPEAMEFAAGAGIGVTMVGRNTTLVAAATGYGGITLAGYEY